MTNIVYKELVFDKKAILDLYVDNEWTLYTKSPDTLFEGVSHSLYCFGAYHNDKLVGLVRVVGDNNTIVYIQDILVLKSYQNKGIGSKLLSVILEKYQNIRQIILTTDHSETQKTFYEKNNFVEFTDNNLTGFYYKR